MGKVNWMPESKVAPERSMGWEEMLRSSRNSPGSSGPGGL
jgi:hypothetical protein